MLAGYANAQENYLQKQISIVFIDLPVEDALKQLSEKGGFLLSYNAMHINAKKRINSSHTKEKISSVLSSILGRGYAYSVAGKHVIIRKNKTVETEKKRSDDNQTAYTIRGYIMDEKGAKVPMATVYAVGELSAVSSDHTGFFSISSNREWTNLYINKARYKDTVLEIFPVETKDLVIRLRSETIIKEELVPLKAEIPFESKLPSLFLSDQQVTQTQSLPLYEMRKAQISLVPALGTNHILSGLVANRISFNILGGYALAVNGFELGGIFNIIRQDVRGVQLAGFTNLTGRHVKGLQLAGFTNSNRGNMKGAQISGFSNVVLDSLRGVQVSGFSNISGETAQGVQISGFLNFSGRAAKGLQLAGFSNITNGDIRGVQLAGFGNYNRMQSNNLQLAGFINLSNSSNGVQIAGFSNFTYREMNGIQLSGILNYAKRIHGIQLGLFNVCDTIRGIPIGFLSFVRKGYHVLEYSMNEQQAFTLSFKTGTHRFYNIVRIGQFVWENYNDLSFGYGFGTQQKIAGKFSVELNMLANGLYNTLSRKVPNSVWVVSEFNVVYQPFRFVTLFAGPSFNYLMHSQSEIFPIDPERGWQRMDDFQHAGRFFTGWSGYSFGVRFF